MSISILLKGLGGEVINPSPEIRSLMGPQLGEIRATAFEGLGNRNKSYFGDVRRELQTPNYAEAVRDVEPVIRRQLSQSERSYPELEEILDALQSTDAKVVSTAEVKLRDMFLRGMGVDPDAPGIFKPNQYGEYGDVADFTQFEGHADTGFDAGSQGGMGSKIDPEADDLEPGATYAEADLDLEADESILDRIFGSEENFVQQMESASQARLADPTTPWQEGVVALRKGHDIPRSAFAGYNKHEGGGRILADLQSARGGGFKFEDEYGDFTGITEEFANLGEGQLSGLLSQIRRNQPAAQHATRQQFDDETTEGAFKDALGERGKFLHPNQMEPEDMMKVVDDLTVQYTGKNLYEMSPDEIKALNADPEYNKMLEWVFIGEKTPVRSGRTSFEESPFVKKAEENIWKGNPEKGFEGLEEWMEKMTPETQRAHQQRQFNIEHWADEPGGLHALLTAAVKGKAGVTNREVIDLKKLYDSYGDAEAWTALVNEYLVTGPEGLDKLAGLLKLRKNPDEFQAAKEALMNPNHPDHDAYFADFSKKWAWRQMAPKINEMIGDKMASTEFGKKDFDLNTLVEKLAKRGEGVMNPKTDEFIRAYDPRFVGKTNKEAGLLDKEEARRWHNTLRNIAEDPELRDIQQHLMKEGDDVRIAEAEDFSWYIPPTGDDLLDPPRATEPVSGRQDLIDQEQEAIDAIMASHLGKQIRRVDLEEMDYGDVLHLARKLKSNASKRRLQSDYIPDLPPSKEKVAALTRALTRRRHRQESLQSQIDQGGTMVPKAGVGYSEEQKQLIDAISEVLKIAEPKLARDVPVDVAGMDRPRAILTRNDKTGKLGVSTEQPDIEGHTARNIRKTEAQLDRRLSNKEVRERQQFMREQAYAPKQAIIRDLHQMTIPELRELWKKLKAIRDEAEI